ncbi:MAG: PEGA domain-containing protein [Myxococcaceae bacterium]|nr:PEGA domain-containing protein [Myxococcaceae bacterium]
MPAYRAVTAVTCWVLAFSAFGQGVELDLTDKPSVEAQFKPTLAFLGVYASGDDVAGQTARAKMLEDALLKSLENGEGFSKIITPAIAQKAAPQGGFTQCREWSCVNAAAVKLGVHRVLWGVVEKRGPGSQLMLYGFDSSLPALIGANVESGEREEKKQLGGFAGINGSSAAQKDRDFVRKALNASAPVLEKLSNPLGKLVIDCIEPSAVTTMGDRTLGTGSFELPMPAGRHDISTEAKGFLPFSTGVTVEPQKTTTVQVLLAAKPLNERAVMVQESTEGQRKIPFYEKPATYVVVGGAAILATGLVFGMLAKQTESTAGRTQNGAVVGITRAQAKQAQTQAMLSNVLVGVVGAAMAGGAVWFILSPTYETPNHPDAERGEPGGGFGFTASVGGSF